MHLFVVAGETSGDAHAARLVAELRELEPDLRVSGLGGPRLHALSDGVEDWTEEAAVIGLWDVLRRYGWFRRKFNAALGRVAETHPDAVLLVDYPGFNLRLAKSLQLQRPPLKIIYYISPQVWAWNRGRIPRMARWLDRMLCIFPFEKELYERSGLPADFVGHPLVEELHPPPPEARDPDLIALLPGSRRREIRKIFPAMLEAAREVAARRPATRFAAAAMNGDHRSAMEQMAAAAGVPVAIGLRNARELMETAAAGLVASGTATLEATLLGLPYALVYKVSWITYVPARMVIKVPYLGMANLLAGRPVVKEFIQSAAQPAAMAAEMLRLLDDPAAAPAMRADFEAVRAGLVSPAEVSPAQAVLQAAG
jgi:lipid-A-disaccharide synthase